MSLSQLNAEHSIPDGSPQAIDALDCFNDDLVWIVDRLVERTGGQFGIVSRHLPESQDIAILATTSAEPQPPERVLNEIAATAERSPGADPDRTDSGLFTDTAWRSALSVDESTGYRILRMAFAPTSNVKLVTSVCRPGADIPFDPIGKMAATKLHPVLARYIRLWWLFRMERRRSASLKTALDLSDVGVLLLDRRAELLFANTRALTLLAAEDGLRRQNQTVAATDELTGFRFQAALQQAIHTNLRPANNLRTAPNSPILSLPRKSNSRALIATAMHVERQAVDIRDPAVIVYVFDPDQNVEQWLAPICDLYRLTVSEARLVQHLVSGHRLIDAARLMRIQPDTARSYLKEIFVKTETNRQADLVRVMFASMARTTAKLDPALLASFD
jgi:PAS domain-containing protein